MESKAVEKAKARLALAHKQLDQASKAQSHDQFAGFWYLFLIAAKNVYTTLEQGAKASAQSRQWFGGKKQLRKDDELLQYLFQARDDDEHGIGEVTALHPGSLEIGKAEPGFSRNISLSFTTDGNGIPTIHNLQSHDGLPVLVQQTLPHSILLPVTGRGNITYAPPTRHLGRALPDNLPVTVGQAALTYLDGLVKEAGDLAA